MTEWGNPGAEGSSNDPAGEQPGQPSQPPADPWAAPAGSPPPPPPAQPDPWAAPPPPPPPPASQPPFGAPPPPPPGPAPYGAPPAFGSPPPPPPPPPGYGAPAGYGAAPGFAPPPGYGAPGAYGAPGFAPGLTPGGMPAQLGVRFLARLIDGAILLGGYIVAVILAFVLPRGLGALFLLAWFVALFCYPAYFNGGPKQATIGKQAMGLKVVDAATGGPIGFGRAFVRDFILGLCIIVAFSPLFDDSKRMQGWHDKAANAFVVKVK